MRKLPPNPTWGVSGAHGSGGEDGGKRAGRRPPQPHLRGGHLASLTRGRKSRPHSGAAPRPGRAGVCVSQDGGAAHAAGELGRWRWLTSVFRAARLRGLTSLTPTSSPAYGLLTCPLLPPSSSNPTDPDFFCLVPRCFTRRTGI